MVKLIGAVLIVVVTTVVGFRMAKKYADRPKQLRQLKFALQSLEAEIMYGHTPLSDAANHLASQLVSPLNTFFLGFSERLQKGSQSVRQAWQESLDDIWRETALGKVEYEILIQFGETLGQHDRESQRKHIILAITHLEKEEQEARENQQTHEKMLKSLGFLTGVLIIILLM